MNSTVYTQVTRHIDAEALTFHFEYRAQQWRTQDFWMGVWDELREVECGVRIFLYFLFVNCPNDAFWQTSFINHWWTFTNANRKVTDTSQGVIQMLGYITCNNLYCVGWGVKLCSFIYCKCSASSLACLAHCIRLCVLCMFWANLMMMMILFCEKLMTSYGRQFSATFQKRLKSLWFAVCGLCCNRCFFCGPIIFDDWN